MGATREERPLPLIRAGYIALLLTTLIGCDARWFPGAWKTYEHPTYRFQIEYPASWEKIENTPFGSEVLFRAPDQNELFRSTANVLVEELKNPQISLQTLVALSEKQLKALLKDYSVLSRAPLQFGSVQAREIRGKYFGSEGERRIRTILMIHNGLQFILTFSNSARNDTKIQPMFNEILDSFVFQKPRK